MESIKDMETITINFSNGTRETFDYHSISIPGLGSNLSIEDFNKGISNGCIFKFNKSGMNIFVNSRAIISYILGDGTPQPVVKYQDPDDDYGCS